MEQELNSLAKIDSVVSDALLEKGEKFETKTKLEEGADLEMKNGDDDDFEFEFVFGFDFPTPIPADVVFHEWRMKRYFPLVFSVSEIVETEHVAETESRGVGRLSVDSLAPLSEILGTETETESSDMNEIEALSAAAAVAMEDDGGGVETYLKRKALVLGLSKWWKLKEVFRRGSRVHEDQSCSGQAAAAATVMTTAESVNGKKTKKKKKNKEMKRHGIRSFGSTLN